VTTHPITLTPSQLRAALAGRLEQVRVPVEPQPEHKQFHEYSGVVIHDSDHRMWCWNDLVLENIWDFPDGEDRKTLVSRCPWGVVGDRLTCESVCQHCNGIGSVSSESFRSYECRSCKGTGEVSVAFDITGIRVERLGDMSEVDALACGIRPRLISFHGHGEEFANPIGDYRYQWDSQHDERHPWASNCWTWVLDVRKVGQ
jgi:hypothetical protein